VVPHRIAAMTPYIAYSFGTIYCLQLWLHILLTDMAPYIAYSYGTIYCLQLRHHIFLTAMAPYIAYRYGTIYCLQVWHHILLTGMAPYVAYNGIVETLCRPVDPSIVVKSSFNVSPNDVLPYVLAPWNSFLLEKPTGFQLDK
jgi:hypothetical protein